MPDIKTLIQNIKIKIIYQEMTWQNTWSFICYSKRWEYGTMPSFDNIKSYRICQTVVTADILKPQKHMQLILKCVWSKASRQCRFSFQGSIK